MLARPAMRRTPPPPTYQTKSVPAPVGGLNAISSQALMPPTDALVLENWFPQPGWIEIRNGYSNQATGFPSWVETILSYRAPGNNHIFGISNGNIYDATAGGAVGAAVVSGLSSSRFEYTQIATPAGAFLYAMNATDSPQLFNGTTWQAVTNVSAPIAITGVTTSLLRNPWVWKNRLWAIEDQSFHAWYLPVQSIGGAMQKLDLSTYFALGGQLQCGFTVSITDASSMDDYIGFLSSEGELLVFRGTDPAFAASFYLAGRFKLAPPVGRRPFFRYAGDTIVIGSDGFSRISAALLAERDDPTKTLSYEVLKLVLDDVKAFNANFGWQGAVHAAGNKLLINVPQVQDSLSYQYVMNLGTQKWCKFTGWNAACIEVIANNFYFGGNGFLALADTTMADNGNAITAKVKPAYNYFDAEGQEKWFKMVRPIYQSNGVPNVSVFINTDFQDVPPSIPLTPSGPTGPQWDVTPWDTSLWGPENAQFKSWIGAGAVGFAGSAYFIFQTSGASVQLYSIDYLYETAKGNVL
jgi:hypothetical protein